MKHPRNLKPFTGRLDVAPFAGVFFLLVMFLLLQSPLAPLPGVRIQLPSVDSRSLPGVANPAVVVAVDRLGLIYFHQQAVTEAGLREKLTALRAAAGEPLTLVLKADEVVPQGTVVRLAAMARSVGIEEVVISTWPPFQPSETDPAPASD